MWAYRNSFAGAFLYDDIPLILENPSIRHLWPPWAILSNLRPVLNLSFALNYAAGGLNTWGYHVVNLSIHVANSLLLFSIIRTTLQSNPLKQRYAKAAGPLAFSITLLWILHPLNTQAVTYITQRSESLMAFFYLLTLYASLRAAHTKHPFGWILAAVASSFLGMGCKPVMATAPLMVLLYDWIFLERSDLKKRCLLYIGLGLSWIPCAIISALILGLPGSSAGFQLKTFSPLAYAATQPGVLLHYLRLAFWPVPLIFDYNWPAVSSVQQILLPFLVILPLAASSFFFAVRRRHSLGFLGCWFFLVLLPTSSFVPIADPAVEYRMYLPLAAVLGLAVLAIHRLLQAIPSARARRICAGALLAGCSVGLAQRTFRRNADYLSEIAIWTDTVAKRPTNSRAHNNLGRGLCEQERFTEGMTHFKEALRLKSDYAIAYQNVGSILFLEGKLPEAILYFQESLKYQPSSEKGHNHLGIALVKQGQLNEALEEFKKAIQCNPDYAESYKSLGLVLIRQGKFSEAIAWYTKTLEYIPEDADLHNDLGALLILQGKPNEAISHFRKALRFQPNMAKAHNNLGLAFAQQGRIDQAIEHFLEVLKINPNHTEARSNLELIRKGGQFPQGVGFNPSWHQQDKDVFDSHSEP